MPCSNLNKARNMLQSLQTTYPLKIFIHTRVNDIDIEHPDDSAYNLKMLDEEYKGKFRCEVFIRYYAKEGSLSPRC